MVFGLSCHGSPHTKLLDWMKPLAPVALPVHHPRCLRRGTIIFLEMIAPIVLLPPRPTHAPTQLIIKINIDTSIYTLRLTAESIEEGSGGHPVPRGLESHGRQRGHAVDTLGDGLDTLRPMVDAVRGRHVGEQSLGRADVGGGLVAPIGEADRLVFVQEGKGKGEGEGRGRGGEERNSAGGGGGG